MVIAEQFKEAINAVSENSNERVPKAKSSEIDRTLTGVVSGM
jgi:hypothetical protein